MIRFITVLATTLLAFSSQASACLCSGGATKTSVWKDVQSRESSVITSREGIPLKAQFWGDMENTDAAPVTAETEEAAPAPVAVSSDVEFKKSYRVEFATNATTPKAASLEEVSELKKALSSGDYKAVKIVGFADQTGTTEYNKTLSLNRAQEVQKMIKSSAPKKTALSTIGAGERETEDLDSARVVEIELVR